MKPKEVDNIISKLDKEIVDEYSTRILRLESALKIHETLLRQYGLKIRQLEKLVFKNAN